MYFIRCRLMRGYVLLKFVTWVRMVGSSCESALFGTVGHHILRLIVLLKPLHEKSKLGGWYGWVWRCQICLWVVCSLYSNIYRVFSVIHIIISDLTCFRWWGKKSKTTCGSLISLRFIHSSGVYGVDTAMMEKLGVLERGTRSILPLLCLLDVHCFGHSLQWVTFHN